MVLEYFTHKKVIKGSHKTEEENVVKTPLLNEEEEKFLKSITSEGSSPLLTAQSPPSSQSRPVKGKDAQTALMDGANEIPLPASPLHEAEQKNETEQTPRKHATLQERKQKYWSNISSLVRKKNKAGQTEGKEELDIAKDKDTKQNREEGGKGTKSKEEIREEDDLTEVLDNLNLAAVNNRAFSFSKESQELLDKFKLVLKDLINGVPTAYDDLEKLLTNSDGQIQRLYGGLPPFLQTLIKGLPSKMTATLGPEILAAASEKPGSHASKLSPDSESSTQEDKHKSSKTPSLKRLVSEQGAVASMLRSILHFLKLRFPVVMTGTNVLMSLAVFLLLFVFWYCHKRGKETRLSRERLSTEVSDSESNGNKVETNKSEESLANSGKPIRKDQQSTKDHTNQEIPKEDKEINLPSVLDLPEPTVVPLPNEEKEDAKKPVV